MEVLRRNKTLRYALAFVCVLALVAIRMFEHEMFYDPFAYYFERDYLNQPFPDYDLTALIGHISFRYFLNMLLSLAIIYFLFVKSELVKLSAVLYIIFFALLIAAFTIVITFFDHSQNFILFYIRRFLIQPLFVLLFVPAFYYQQQIQNKQP